ncbi:MAG: Uma2 family endonuclease [Blastocatellia bacterium]|nr:Uma2 family endonuclease [Blastocatellia bacterium]
MATILNPVEQKLILRNISWETYERLLADHASSSAPRFTYDRGVLEIMSPSPDHERANRAIALLVEVLAEELNLDVENLGSTTFRREDLERGFEPDSCFYIQNQARIHGKSKIDLTIDPPPDLIIEIDITSPSLDKFPIYAELGVPEIWRYHGEKLSVLELAGQEYIEREESLAFPRVTSADLTRFLEESKTVKRTSWLRTIRGWARKCISSQDRG